MKQAALYFGIIFGCAVSSDCGSSRTVRRDDLLAWQGAPTVELQVHPFFSTVPKSVEHLQDGSELWTYSNCHSGQTAQVCNTIGKTVICNGGNPTRSCCHNQFLVQGAHVAWYRAVGDCYTDCSVRPSSRPCVAPDQYAGGIRD